MVKYLEDKKASLIVLIVCFVTYMILSFTRNAYTAAVAGIINEGIFTKFDAGTISSSFYITYGAAQFFGSYLTDKVSPYKIIFIGLMGTIVANVAMAVSASYAVIFTARAISGISQFGTWPALLKIVTEYINKDYRRKAMYLMPLGMQAGTILSFLVASAVLSYGKWQDLFTISYILLAVITVIYIVSFVYAEKRTVMVESDYSKKTSTKNENEENKISDMRLIWTSGALLLIAPIIIKSMLANGLSSWMPTMIMESYSTSPGFSSVLTTVTNCSNFVSVFWVMFLYPKYLKSQAIAVTMFFIMSLPLIVPLIFIGKTTLAVVVVLVTLINVLLGAMHQFFTVEIPSAYSRYNKSGTIAGLINAVSCIGAVLSGILFGYMAEKFGWSVTIGLWAVLVVIGVIFGAIYIPVWKKFLKQK